MIRGWNHQLGITSRYLWRTEAGQSMCSRNLVSTVLTSCWSQPLILDTVCTVIFTPKLLACTKFPCHCFQSAVISTAPCTCTTFDFDASAITPRLEDSLCIAKCLAELRDQVPCFQRYTLSSRIRENPLSTNDALSPAALGSVVCGAIST